MKAADEKENASRKRALVFCLPSSNESCREERVFDRPAVLDAVDADRWMMKLVKCSSALLVELACRPVAVVVAAGSFEAE